MANIRVMVADDNDIIRVDLSKLLDLEEDIEVIGVATDGIEAVDFFRRLRPDIVVMDVRMPGLSGVEATRRITSESPEAKVVILSIHDRPEYREQSRKAGARAYLLKGTLFEELTETIRRVSKE